MSRKNIEDLCPRIKEVTYCEFYGKIGCTYFCNYANQKLEKLAEPQLNEWFNGK